MEFLWNVCIIFMIIMSKTIENRKKQKKNVHFSSFQASLLIPFPPGIQWSETPPYFPHKNKDFINHSLCRNRAIYVFIPLFRSCQKPYWDQARLSSLVNKQVGLTSHSHQGQCNISKLLHVAESCQQSPRPSSPRAKVTSVNSYLLQYVTSSLPDLLLTGPRSHQ